MNFPLFWVGTCGCVLSLEPAITSAACVLKKDMITSNNRDGGQKLCSKCNSTYKITVHKCRSSPSMENITERGRFY